MFLRLGCNYIFFYQDNCFQRAIYFSARTIIPELQKGYCLQKVRSGGKKHRRFYFIDDEVVSIMYSRTEAKRHRSKIAGMYILQESVFNKGSFTIGGHVIRIIYHS